MIDSAGHRWSSTSSDVTNDHIFPQSSTEASILELNVKSTVYTSSANICNIDSAIISDSNNSIQRQSSIHNNFENNRLNPLSDLASVETGVEHMVTSSYSNVLTSSPEHLNSVENIISFNELDNNDHYEDSRGEAEEVEDQDEYEDADEDESNDDNDDDEEVEEEEEEEEDDDDDESENSEDIVDPGQHCQLVSQQTIGESVGGNFVECDDRESDDVLDGERMLEVTRKLVRSTERDPDRDLRKQVLLKTAIKKLPHFMEYTRYSESLERCHNGTISSQNYYEHQDSQQKFYHPVQPNSIQMSTTSLRMLDLNDDHDPELGNIEQEQDPNLDYNTRASLEHHDYVQHQYDRYHHRTHDLNQYDTGNHIIGRHNSLDNLYQPINGSDMSVDIKDGDERIPIAFQIACEIYDFTCNPDDNERKLLDNLTNDYYPTRPTKEARSDTSDVVGRDGLDNGDQDGSDGGSNSNSSTTSSTDESASSIGSQCSADADETNGTSLLETSLNSEPSDFYHSSHDSGVALFSPRTNKRSSSSIGLDDEMEIDHLTELPIRSPNIAANNHYKKLRKRETID